ncbi:hypothetical protein P0F65_16600 [Sphingomonas sp. I4]
MALIATPAVAAAPDSSPRPGGLKLFRDWIVACDNGRACESASLATQDSALQDVGLIVARDGAGRVTVRVRDMTGRAKTASVRVDGRTVASTTLDRDGEGCGRARPPPRWSRRSAGAARRDPDPDQSWRLAERCGGGLALYGRPAEARGHDHRADRARLCPPSRHGARLAAGACRHAAAWRGRRSRHRHRRSTPSLWLRGGRWQSVQRRRAPARRAIDPRPDVLRCGAYNYLVKPLIWRDGRLTPASFDFAYHFGETPIPASPKSWSTSPGRPPVACPVGEGPGLGDCGDAQTFGWDGTRFRLLEAARMTECRGRSTR